VNLMKSQGLSNVKAEEQVVEQNKNMITFLLIANMDSLIVLLVLSYSSIIMTTHELGFRRNLSVSISF
jgi:hypothetical protein